MENYFRNSHNKGALRGAIQSAQGGVRGGRSPRKEGRKGAGPQPLRQRQEDGALSRQARYSPRGGRRRAQEAPHAGRPGAGGRGSHSRRTAARRAIAPAERQRKEPQRAQLRRTGPQAGEQRRQLPGSGRGAEGDGRRRLRRPHSECRPQPRPALPWLSARHTAGAGLRGTTPPDRPGACRDL